MDDSAVRQILLGMKAELAAGWIQGDLMEYDVAGAAPGVCLFGALIRAAKLPMVMPSLAPCRPVAGRLSGGAGWEIHDGTAAADAVMLLADIAGVPFRSLALWNDVDERTAEDVVDLVDEALALLPIGDDRPRYRCGIAAIDRLDLRRIAAFSRRSEVAASPRSIEEREIAHV